MTDSLQMIVAVILMVTPFQVTGCGNPASFNSADFLYGGNICGASDTDTMTLALGPYEDGGCGKYFVLQACDFMGLHDNGNESGFASSMAACISEGSPNAVHAETGGTASWTTTACRDAQSQIVLGYFAGMCKTGTWSMDHMQFYYPDGNGVTASTNEVCIVPVSEGGVCGAANQWDAGETKWSMYATNLINRSNVDGYNYGFFKWYFDPRPLCNDGETVDYNVGDSVTKLTMTCTETSTSVEREVMVVDFVQTYNYGIQGDSGDWESVGTGDAQVKVEKTENNGPGWIQVKVPRVANSIDWADKNRFVLYDPQVQPGSDIAQVQPGSDIEARLSSSQKNYAHHAIALNSLALFASFAVIAINIIFLM